MHTLCIMTSSHFAGLSLAGFIQYFHQIVVHTNWFESYEAAVICTDDIWRESFSMTTTKTNTSIINTHQEVKFHTNMFKHWSLDVNLIGICSLTKSLPLKIKTFFNLWCWLSCYLTIFKKNSNNNDHLDIFFLGKIINNKQ